MLEEGGNPNVAGFVGRTGVVGMKKNCWACGERGSPWKAMLVDMLGLGRLGRRYGIGELIKGAGGRPLDGIYEVLVLLVELLVLLVAEPGFSKVSIEKPKDCDLFMLKGDAKGPQLNGAVFRNGIPPAWLAREDGIVELVSVEAPVTVGGWSGNEPCCIRW